MYDPAHLAFNKSTYAFVYNKPVYVYILQANKGRQKYFVLLCVSEIFSACSPLHFVTHSSSGYDLAPPGGLWGPLAKLVSAAPGTRVAGP